MFISNLEVAVTSSLIPALTPVTGHYSMDTDARDTEVRYVLLQQQPIGTDRPTGHCSELSDILKKTGQTAQSMPYHGMGLVTTSVVGRNKPVDGQNWP